MNLRIVVAPTQEPVTLAQAKLHLRLAADGDPVDSPAAPGPDDSVIQGLIVTAREHAEQYTGRAFTDATYELRFGAFDSWAPLYHTPITSPYWVQPWQAGRALDCGIALPLAPVQSVEGFTYVDEDGVTQDVDDAVFVLDDDPDHPSVRLAYGASWPAIRYEPNAVRLQFKAGYTTLNPLPRAAVQAMLLMIGEWYENRENATVTSGSAVQIPLGAMTLLTPLRRIMGV